MKKMLLMMVSLLSLFSFAACNMDSGDDTGSEGEVVNNGRLEEKKALYARIVGTSWKNTRIPDFPDAVGIGEISFAEDSITIDGTQISLNQNKDFYFYDELDDKSEGDKDSLLSIKVAGKMLNLSGYRININYPYNDGYFCILQNYKLSSNSRRDNVSVTYDPFKLVSSSSEIENTTSELDGIYTFNSATGSQSKGCFTLKDGSWSYTGDKSNVAASSGTYTVDDSKITMKWTATIDLEETFAVSTSGSSSTWTSEESGVSNFFSMLFGVTKTEMTFDYSTSE